VTADGIKLFPALWEQSADTDKEGYLMAISKKNNNEILLESGTNELEVMEFTIDTRHFGINVAKVVEIMQYSKVTPMPNSNPFVEGVFKPRDTIMTVINLASYMGLPATDSEERNILIITNFNKVYSAFHVHSVDGIHRISWANIEKPDPTIYGGEEGLATGIARYDNRLITILDFEKILADISPETGIQASDIKELGARPACHKPVLLAEDSPLLEKMIMESLEKSGYDNLTLCTNGKEAWDKLQTYKATGEPIANHVACIVSDIEMPQMDGHRLLKLIRDDPELKEIPVIIFSSLINEEMRRKGESLGATAQITKPEIAKLVSLIDRYIL
jgi:two-component system chemotaxis response regulator CheV